MNKEKLDMTTLEQQQNHNCKVFNRLNITIFIFRNDRNGNYKRDSSNQDSVTDKVSSFVLYQAELLLNVIKIYNRKVYNLYFVLHEFEGKIWRYEKESVDVLPYQNVYISYCFIRIMKCVVCPRLLSHGRTSSLWQ